MSSSRGAAPITSFIDGRAWRAKSSLWDARKDARDRRNPSRRRDSRQSLRCPADGADPALSAALLEAAYGLVHFFAACRPAASCSDRISPRSPSIATSLNATSTASISWRWPISAWCYLVFVVLFIQTYTTQYTGQRAMHDLRMEIFSHLQKQDMAYFDRNAVGRLMTRTVNDVETLNELFSTGVVGLLGDVSIVFGIAAIMFWLDWQLALVCLAAFPAILYISRFYRRRAREVYRESRLILGRLNAGLQENIAGVATIQAFGQEEKMYRRFQEINLSYRDVLAAQHPLQRGIFPGHRNIQRAEHRAFALVRRPADSFQRRPGRRDRRLHPVYPAHVSADPRSGGEIQHHAGGHGFRRKESLRCSIRRRPLKIRLGRNAPNVSPAKSNSKTSGFPTVPG